MKRKIMATLAACTLFAETAPAVAAHAMPLDPSVVVESTAMVGARKGHDLRAGFGKAALARAVHGFVATLGAGRVVLVGHDIGGMVAHAYARRYPDELADVAILDVPVPGVAPRAAVETLPEAWHFGFHARAPLAEQLAGGRRGPYFRYFIDSHAADPAAVSAADEAFNDAHHAPFAVPVLLAGADRSMDPGEVQLEAGPKAFGASDVRIAVVPKSGHWIAEQQPASTARLIADFATGRHGIFHWRMYHDV